MKKDFYQNIQIKKQWQEIEDRSLFILVAKETLESKIVNLENRVKQLEPVKTIP